MNKKSNICRNCERFKDEECRIFKGAKAQCTMYELDDSFGCNKFKELNKDMKNIKAK